MLELELFDQGGANSTVSITIGRPVRKFIVTTQSGRATVIREDWSGVLRHRTHSFHLATSFFDTKLTSKHSVCGYVDNATCILGRNVIEREMYTVLLHVHIN